MPLFHYAIYTVNYGILYISFCPLFRLFCL
nr:MAG TPA: hypothetical protein [Caudoviricetes sp.]